MSSTAIIVTGYNRADALSSLLKSLSKIITKRTDIALIISLENKATSSVIEVANRFTWMFGEKKVVIQERQLGLRDHFLWVGDQTEYYDNVIFLEDDLYVSPYLLDGVEQLVKYYSCDKRVAAISLYSPLICEFNQCRFYPLDDGSDVYFFQHPYWGNVWQRDKWIEFKKWLLSYQRNEELLPLYVRTWGDTSFKVVFIQYLIETNKYVVYPRVSYVDNMGFSGLHNKEAFYTFRVPLVTEKRILTLRRFDNSNSIYDARFEILPGILKKMNPELRKYDFEVNLQENGDCKRGMMDCGGAESPFVLTYRKSKKPILEFDGDCKPAELGVGLNREGNSIVLSRKKDLVVTDSRMNKLYRMIMNNNLLSFRLLLYMLFFHIKLWVKHTMNFKIM